MTDKTDKESMKKKEYNQYYYEKTLEDVNDRFKDYQRIIDNFENWMMRLSAGSFGLSFAFISNFVELKTAECLIFLKISWLCFVICLIFGLLDYFITANGRLKTIKNMWIEYENEVEGKNNEKLSEHSDIIDSVLTFLNLILFSAGIICLIIFVFQNIS